MVFDITNLMLSGAFGLFIALLAWGDQIRMPRKEIMQLEETFRKEFDLKKSVTNPLIHKSYNSMQSSQRYTFLQQTRSMINLLENPKMRGGNVKLLSQFRKLHGIRKQLEMDYTFRYVFSIWLCIFSFTFGLISIYADNVTLSLNGFSSSINNIFLFVLIIMVAVLVHNFLKTHKGENYFVEEIYATDNQIEVEE